MEQQQDLDFSVPFDGYDGFTALPRSTPRALQDRTIQLKFDKVHDGYLVHAWGPPDTPLCYDGNAPYSGRLRVDHEQISQSLEDIHDAWLKATVLHRHEGAYPFEGFPEQTLGRRSACELLQEACETLARAGQRLYGEIFESGDEDLDRLAAALSHALRSGPQIITVTSSDLFVPWGLLYLHPDIQHGLHAGGTAVWDGFLGYTHLIEHNLGRVDGYSPFIEHGGERPKAGLYLDTRLEREGAPDCPLSPVRNVFDTHTAAQEWTTKAETAQRLTSSDCSDHIMLFSAHATGNRTDHRGQKSARIILTDDNPIIAGDINDWVRHRSQLLPSPLCFMMACEGGRAGQYDQQGLARPLFKLGIGCLVGPQIEVPPSVASSLTTRFFEEFFKGERAACILRDITKDFISQHASPLGLAFTLIRGIDTCLIHSPQAEKP
ncbi:CHAT domain-containing protein [Streptomyces sp. WAC04114]|uniref:CHAT domain-containing protein n=1 Tax=Streptomyces sp. WAC04114 TaxID=2867961 RepID=UPI001C8B1750|nr:CHAT domain-containing protein [Streptomyces sp. WAC04114]MBX9365571.1 CHAT domain-containing protein [Streptomyces sp. WAC04114]